MKTVALMQQKLSIGEVVTTAAAAAAEKGSFSKETLISMAMHDEGVPVVVVSWSHFFKLYLDNRGKWCKK